MNCFLELDDLGVPGGGGGGGHAAVPLCVLWVDLHDAGVPRGSAERTLRPNPDMGVFGLGKLNVR